MVDHHGVAAEFPGFLTLGFHICDFGSRLNCVSVVAAELDARVDVFVEVGVEGECLMVDNAGFLGLRQNARGLVRQGVRRSQAEVPLVH